MNTLSEFCLSIKSTAEQAAWIQQAYQVMSEESENGVEFSLQIQPTSGPDDEGYSHFIDIHHNEDSGPHATTTVAELLQDFLIQFDRDDHIVFEYVERTAKVRLDGYGGGVVGLDRHGIHDMTTKDLIKLVEKNMEMADRPSPMTP